MRTFLLPMLPALFLLPLGGQDNAAVRPGDFTRTLYPVLEKAGCRGCHNTDGVAAATRLRFPEDDAAPARREAFGKSLVALVDRAHPAQSLLLNKPTLRIAHTGGQRIAPGTAEEETLRAWVDYLASLTPAEAALAVKMGRATAVEVEREPVLRRLTHSQYNHTVLDLLGDESNRADQFPPEDFVNGYKGQSGSQAISPLLAEAYSAAAEKLARNAFRGGDALRVLVQRQRHRGEVLDPGADGLRLRDHAVPGAARAVQAGRPHHHGPG